MKCLKKETVITMIFSLSLAIIFVCIVPIWYFAREKIRLIDEGYDLVVTPIDWEERYPFENDTQKCAAKENAFVDLQTRYLSHITWIESKMTSIVTNGIIAKYPISELYCSLQKNLGYKRFASEEIPILVLDNGVYSFQSETDNTINNAAITKKMSEFQQWLNGKGIEYLYVMEPCKTSPVNENNIYEGYVDFQKHNMDMFATLMEQSNINFLNLQEEAAAELGEVNDLFYKTDHHWKPSTALWAAKVVAENLNERLGYQIDVSRYDSSAFETIDYGDRFLGSQGKKVTLGFAEPDHFELLLPAYDTELHVIIEDRGIDKIGTFKETLIDKYHLRDESYPNYYYRLSEYHAYGYGDRPLITIENNFATNNCKVLILRDSFVDCMGPFFALGVHDLSLVDLRHFTGSIQTYIQEYEPDIVITMCTKANYNLSDDYELHTNILDYR